MEADSCATVNIMDYTQYTTIMNAWDKPVPLKPATNSLYAYAQNQPLRLTGKLSTTVRSLTTDREVEAEFLVWENNSNSRPLLNLTTSSKLGIISIPNAVTGSLLNKDQLKREFPSAFNGFGKHTKIKAKYIEDTSVTPIIQKPKRVPYNLEKRAMEEGDRLIAQDIIEMVPDDVPTTWCTNPVVAPKPHDPEAIRYCSNMRAANTAIKRPITEALTFEDIKVRLACRLQSILHPGHERSLPPTGAMWGKSSPDNILWHT